MSKVNFIQYRTDKNNLLFNKVNNIIILFYLSQF